MRQTLYNANRQGPGPRSGTTTGIEGAPRSLSPWMAGIAFFFCFLFFPLFCSYGAQHIVLYDVGQKDPAALSMLRKHLAAKGFGVSVFDGTNTIEKQIELANRINRLRASLFIAIDFSFAEGEDTVVTIAVTDVKKKTDKVLAIEEVPGPMRPPRRNLRPL